MPMKTLPPNVVTFPGPGPIKRRPGRPRVVRPAPSFDEAEYVQQVAMAADNFIASDAIVMATEPGERTDLDRLDAVLRGLAEEQAALLYQRLKLQREGREGAAQVSSRRVDALLKIARLVVMREQLRAADPEPDPADVALVIGMIMADAKEVLAEVAPADVGARFLDSIRARMAAAHMPCRTVPR